MLSAAFLVSVFASVLWVFYALANSANGSVDSFVITTAVVVLPIFVLWAVFGYIYQYISVAVLNKNMYSLFKQMKKNQDYSDVIAKILLEAGEGLKDNIMLGKVDIFIADMNELLSDIIKRGQLTTPEQINDLWLKVKNGGKWAFGKVIIEQYQNQSNLPSRLLQRALQDAMLGGTILEFCSRYQNFIGSLEKHDKERLFLNIVETGVLGKVFSILAAPADSIRQNRELSLAHRQISEEREPEEQIIISKSKPETEKKSTSSGLSENARRLFINTFTRKKPEVKEEVEEAKDPLSVAFAKSFGAEEISEDSYEEYSNESRIEPTVSFLKPETEPQISESVLEIEQEEEEAKNEMFDETPREPIFESSATPKVEPILSAPEIVFREEPKLITPEFKEETEKTEPVFPVTPSIVVSDLENSFNQASETLSHIKQEWEAAKQRDLKAQKNVTPSDEGMPEPKISNNNDFSYPFGEWMNADNYK